MADFHSILDEAQNSEDATAAYENFHFGKIELTISTIT